MSHNSSVDTSEIFYIYDGSYEGLLTVIYTAVYARIIPSGISTEKSLQFALNTRYVEVVTNRNYARRVHDALYRKIGFLGLKRLYYVFLSNHPDKDLVIYNYMMLGFKNGDLTNSALSNDTVAEAFKIAEDSNGVVIRAYEPMRKRGVAQINVGFGNKAYVCDMLENEIEEIEITNGKIILPYKPFEIITIKVK